MSGFSTLEKRKIKIPSQEFNYDSSVDGPITQSTPNELGLNTATLLLSLLLLLLLTSSLQSSLLQLSSFLPPSKHYLQAAVCTGTGTHLVDAEQFSGLFQRWCGEENNLLLLSGIELEFLSNPFHSAVAVLTASLQHPVFHKTTETCLISFID